MEIQIDFKTSVIKDILNSLFILENKEVFDKQMLEILPYSMDKNVEKYFQELTKNKNVDKEKLSFYFHHFYFNEEIFTIANCLDADNVKEMSFCDVEQYLSKLRNRSEEQILKRLVPYLAYRKEKGNTDVLEEYENTYRDKNKISELLKECNIPAEAKWNVYMIVSEPKKYMNEFCEFIEGFLPVFNNAFERLTPLKEKFDNYIAERIKSEGIEYFRRLPSFENLDKFKKVIVATMTVNYASLIASDVDDTVYVDMGMNFEKVLEVVKGKNDEEVFLSLLKTISDSSRFNMLKALQREELFGIELAERLGLSNATISHHISFLQLADLIAHDRRNGKTYYKLNKEPLRKMVDTIIREFNL